jgi:cytochrome c553
MKNVSRILFGGVLFFNVISISTFASAIGDLAEAKCVKCHNPDFRGMPQLGGQNSTYLFKSMKAYQSGERHAHYAIWYMFKRVQFDDITLSALAKYLVKKPAGRPLAGDPIQIEMGREIYENGIEAKGVISCAECHGEHGRGLGRIPRLASQPASFIANQMSYYKADLIDNQPLMTGISKMLTSEESEALAAYLQSQ